ncbi:TrbI/VirB10 family protein [Sphingobium fuliginis]|nr:TrbI/VirB10 family protein [Sphingobium fuliginis]
MAAIGIVAAGAILFSILDTHRRSLSAPAVNGRVMQDLAVDSSPPALYIPPEPQPPIWYTTQQPFPPAPTRAPAAPPPATQTPIQHYAPPTQQAPYVPGSTLSRQQPPRNAGAPMLFDASQGVGAATNDTDSAAGGRQGEGRGASARARAGIIANRSTTVPQGTIVPAVLETAIDSSSAGYARALVQRDIRGFDGSRILIPRGSRLIGEYQSNTSAGQKRALITWVRLIRPDGGTIALGSPATDPVGKGGVKAKVDSHFFERFSGAILQSALDVGVNLAARSADSSVVLAMPGSFNGTGQATAAAQIPPTLSVRQGTSVSVFVARDLDFTDIEDRP